MVELLDPGPGTTLLEIAAGPGETGLRAFPLLQPGGELISTDVAPEMIAAARARALELGFGGVRFQVEDAAALSLPDGSVDAVLSRFGIMLVPAMDRVAAEIARVLRPGGRVVLAVWASPRLNPWITASGRAALSLGFADPPDHDAPGPFRLADPERLSNLVADAGLTVERLEDVPVAWSAPSYEQWWAATCDTSRMLSRLLEHLTPSQAAALRARAEENLRPYLAEDGSLAVPGQARIVAATR